jgi:hypothetical protein
MRATVQPRACIVLIALQLMLALGRMPTSYAPEFNSNSGHDVRDLGPGNGLCVAYLIVFAPFVLPFCTLRAAIEETNALSGQDIINVPSGHFLLDIAGINEDHAATGDLDITGDLIIRGNGAGQTFLDGNGLDRGVDIIESGAEVIIQDLTIINGGLPATLTAGQGGGGGVRNRGNLTLRNVVLANNRINGSSPEDGRRRRGHTEHGEVRSGKKHGQGQSCRSRRRSLQRSRWKAYCLVKHDQQQ